MKNITFTVLLTLVISLPLQANAQSFWDKVDGFLGNEGTSTSKQKPGLAETILSNEEVASGLKEALTIGAVAVIGMVGTQDGFNLDPNIHIPLPSSLQKVDSALSAVGMNSLTQDLELKLNRAAELAAPKAKDLFVQAIKDMTIEDAKGILNGPDNSATTYLRKSMGGSLAKELSPIVDQTLSSAGAIKSYDNVMGEYKNIPFAPDLKANLNSYVVDKAMDGIFYYVAKEEAAIRSNPAKRTTDLLKRVFTSNSQ